MSVSYPHEEILRQGVFRSVVKYFYDQPNGSLLVNMSKIDQEYLDITNLYSDFYNSSFCSLSLPIEKLVAYEFQPNVGNVDFESLTKDMPYAHFDAETFTQSNQRVIYYLANISQALAIKDYFTARSLSGRILHTIQDFYSHSNWVEMGMTTINTKIGYDNFSTLAIIDKNGTACNNTCTLTQMGCGTLVKIAIKLIKVSLLFLYLNLFEKKQNYYYQKGTRFRRIAFMSC